MHTSTTVDLNSKIPNNVGLADDPKLRRALEKWLPLYLEWWNDMGPTDFADKPVYLRTAISVDSSGWAHYDHVRMPDYRWCIFLNPRKDGESIVRCGDDAGKPAWQTVPGEHRNALRRIIVTQADTEPASVEQQRLLGKCAPSLYDLRNLFQVNVEEGRHLWAMVYLLMQHFGRDGREEAEDLLARRSGDADSPRILEAFNKLYADEIGTQYLETLHEVKVPEIFTERVPQQFARNYTLIGVDADDDVVRVATCNPLEVYPLDDLASILQARERK